MSELELDFSDVRIRDTTTSATLKLSKPPEWSWGKFLQVCAYTKLMPAEQVEEQPKEEVKERAWPLETAEEMAKIAEDNDNLPSAYVIKEIRKAAKDGKRSISIRKKLFTKATFTLLMDKEYKLDESEYDVTISWRKKGIHM